MVFPLLAVTLDTGIAIMGFQNLSIGRPGASFYHLGDDFVGTLGDHGSSRKVTWGPGT